MTNRLQRLLAGARTLEVRLTTVVERAAQSLAGPGDAAPLEIIEQAVDEIALHVQPSGRGRFTFAFNDVQVTFAAASAEAQAQLEALCDGPPSLADRIVRRLASAGCPGADVDVRVAFAPAPDPSWTRPAFHVALARAAAAARASRTPAVRIDLFVTHGAADRGTYSFTSLPIAIGRGAEVRDSRHQLLRVNHVAFTEGADEITSTVSRRHARIELDAATGRARLIDDNSAQGSSVIRGGRGIAVPRGSRGLGLRDGDEIVLGQARVRVRI
jgi:hypothetical protein